MIFFTFHVSWGDPLFLIFFRRVAGELHDLSGQVFENTRQVHSPHYRYLREHIFLESFRLVSTVKE